MTPYTALETLLAYVGVVLALVVFSLLIGAVAGWLTRESRQARTTPEDRREKLLKLISSTERGRHR